MNSSEKIDYTRRFSGVSRLYGEDALKRFSQAKVCVAGIGGVGSWVAEALARSAIGHITLIDLDMIAESNTNRQIHALGNVYGMAKVDAMRERILAINPLCQVQALEAFVSEQNIAELLEGHDFVIDAIDHVRVKASMAAFCRDKRMPLIMCGGAGGKSDPTKVSVDDLTRTEQDPLLAKVRSRMRKEYGFSRNLKRRFDIEAVFSTEPLERPELCDSDAGPQGLSCAGYGSSVCVTSVFGFVAASRVLHALSAKDLPAAPQSEFSSAESLSGD